MSQWQLFISAQNLSEGDKANALQERLKEKAGYMAFKRRSFTNEDEARAAAEELRDKLVEVDDAIEWDVSYANSVIDGSSDNSVRTISSTPTAASRKKRYESLVEKFDYQHTVDEKDKAVYEPVRPALDGIPIIEVLTAHGVHVLTGEAKIPDDVSPESHWRGYGDVYWVGSFERHCLISQEEFNRRLHTLRQARYCQSGIWSQDKRAYYQILGI